MQYTGNGSSAYGAAGPPPQAVSSKRMTYGAINSGTREARERDELLAGADPYRSTYQQQQQVPQQEQSNDELMQQAMTTHKDTTATAKRALQVRGSFQRAEELRLCTRLVLTVASVAGARADQGNPGQHTGSPA